MKNKLNFETFMDQYQSEFMDYLSRSSVPDHEEEEIRKLRNEIADIYKRYPNVMHVLDLGMAHSLTEEESEALIQVVGNHSYISMLEEANVYYKGCADSIGYLRKLKMLKEPEG